MLGLATPDSDVWLSLAHNPKRKLKFTWELIRVHTHLVDINTSLPNTLASEAIAAGNIPELTGYESARREVRYGENSRIDILLESPDKRPCYVEIKNVHLKRDTTLNRGLAEFPDSVTTRSAKHLRELGRVVSDRGPCGDAVRGSAGRLRPVFPRRRHRSGLCGGIRGGPASGG